MENNQKLEILIYLYDSAALQIKKKWNPSILNGIKIPKEIPQIPTWAERITLAAWDICFLSYLKDHPNATFGEFKTNWIGTAPGIKAFQAALDYVAEKLEEDIKVDKLIEFKNWLLTS